MHGHDLGLSAAENYRAFAQDAHGRSPAYECLAASVAEDTAILRFLGSLPPERRQPTLLFDRYSYDYAGHQIAGQDPRAPVLRCTPRGPVPLPDRLPAITWRAGLDLDPLDVTSDDDVRWLSCLVWPGEGDREQRLAAAIAAARRDPPVIHRGDLLTDLPALAAQAPAEATLVVYHSAVLAYLTPQDRRRFAGTVRGLPAVWLSNEGPAVLPGIRVPAYQGAPFILARDGQTPLAFTDSHGTWLHWLTAT